MKYYMEHTKKGMYSDDVANYIAEKIQEKTTGMTDEQMEKIADEIYAEVEDMDEYNDSREFYGFEVWTAERENERTCCICGRTYCNCDALIDEARGK